MGSKKSGYRRINVGTHATTLLTDDKNTTVPSITVLTASSIQMIVAVLRSIIYK